MRSVYIKEQHRYLQSDIASLLQLNDDDTVSVLRRVKNYGILKLVKIKNQSGKDLSDIPDSDTELTEIMPGDTQNYYVFNFVGLLVVKDYLLKIYPKYIQDISNLDDKFQEVISVLEKCDAARQRLKLYSEDESGASFNKLSVSLALLNDYYENGSYKNEKRIIEKNGPGDALWDKTVNEVFAVIINGRPYYPDIYTRRKVRDDSFYYHRLHNYILTQISNELEAIGILDLLGMTEVQISEENIDDLGGKDFAEEQILREQNIEFNTRKLTLLKLMYLYLVGKGSFNDIEWFQLFGTKNYNLVWEKICGEVFENQRDEDIKDVKLPALLNPTSNYKTITCLKDVICKPLWIGSEENGNQFSEEAEGTLIPDFLSVGEKNGQYTFYILDAKYYVMYLQKGEEVVGQPGVGDIIKQFMYQQAFKNFLKDYGITKVENCFLMPYDGDEVVSKAKVRMSMIDSLYLADIDVRLVPAREINRRFLNGTHIKDLAYLKIN